MIIPAVVSIRAGLWGPSCRPQGQQVYTILANDHEGFMTKTVLERPTQPGSEARSATLLLNLGAEPVNFEGE